MNILSKDAKEMYLILHDWKITNHLPSGGQNGYKIYYPFDGHPYLKYYRYTLSLDRAFKAQKRADKLR